MSYSIIWEAVKYLLWRRHPTLFFRDVWRHKGWYPTKSQYQFLEDMANLDNRWVLITAGNGTGKTLTLATLSLWSTIVLSRVEKMPIGVLIASGSKRQADIMYEYIMEIIEHNDWIKPLLRQEPTKTLTSFIDGSWIRPATASIKFIWGHHPNVMIIDEAVLTEDRIIRDAVFRVAPKENARLIICSTPYDYLSFFVEMWNNTKKYSHFLRYHFSMKDAYWMTEGAEKIAKSLPEDEYKIRWLGIPTPKISAFFNQQYLKACRISREELEQYLKEDGEFYLGVDWGYEHPTALVVVKKIGDKLVVVYSEQRNRLTGDEVVNWIIKVYKDYHISEIYCDSQATWEIMRLEEKGLPAISIKFHTEKQKMLNNTRSLINTQKLLIPDYMEELLLQIANYIPTRKKNDDLVDALILACRCSSYYESSEGEILFVSSKIRRRL